MRPAFFLLTVLLLLLTHEIQGIRLEHGVITIGHQKIHKKESSLIQANGGDVGEAVLCRDGHCSTSSGRSTRKLMTKTIPSSTASTPKSVKSGGTEVDPKSKHQSSNIDPKLQKQSFPVKQQQASSKHQTYPDIIDIAGMDYTPARKKTPIHN